MWTSKVNQHLRTATKRTISSSAVVRRVNHYDVLGITPKATQAEVKAAYYNLSKKHHPDISGKDGDGGNQFRLITEAYDVLGNYRSRQLYDKGLYGHSRDTVRKDTTPDHPKMAFYKSRFDKSRVPTSQSSQGIYNFDEWTRQHYSETFAKTAAFKKAQKKSYSEDPREITQDDAVAKLAIVSVAIVTLLFSLVTLPSSHDTPKQLQDKNS